MSEALRESGGLYLPSSVIEERAIEVAERRLRQIRQETPAMVPTTIGGVGLGLQPPDAALLAETRGWAAIAANAIASRVMALEPLVFVDRVIEAGTTQAEQLDDHPAKTLLDDPGPIFTRSLMLRLASYHVLQTGHAYWQKIRDGIGRVVELWPLPPQNVVPEFGGPDVIAGYRVTGANGRQVVIPRSEIVRIWLPDPVTLFGALGHLGPQASEWDAERYRVEHLREHFGNDATPRVVVEGEKDATAPDPDEREVFWDEWRSRFMARAGMRRGLPAFLPSGFKANILDAHGGTTELVPIGDAFAKQILMAYGVPRSIVGDVVDVNRAAAETNQYVFDRVTVSPLVYVMAEAITKQLLVADFDPALYCEFEPFVAPDKAFELSREKQDLETKVRSAQQVIEDRGGDPDRAPWGELPVGSIADTPYTGEPLFDDGGESAEDLEDRGAEGADSWPVGGCTSSEPAAPRSARAESPATWWALLVRAERRFGPKMMRATASVFEAQRRDVARRLRRFWPNRGRSIDLDAIFTEESWAELWAQRVLPIRRRAYAFGATESSQLLGAEFVFTEEVEAQVARQGAAMVSQIDSTTRGRIVATLRESLLAGESVDKAVKRLSPILGNRKRARTVARTETLKAQQSGQLESFSQAGEVRGKRWGTALDDVVRDTHVPLEGVVVALNETFDVGGFPGRHPGDVALPASEVVNCRCFLSPVLRGDEE